MSKNVILGFFLFLVLMTLPLFYPTSVYAARNINSATLNGGTSVTVAPSASINAAVTVTTAGPGPTNWGSTSWLIGSGTATCVNHTDHSTAGTYVETFTITAPASNGVYNSVFIAYDDNACGTGASNTFTLPSSVTVTTPTPTPTGTATPTPSGTPTPPSSTSTTLATVYYPSVSLSTTYTTVPQGNLSLAGTASVENGTIAKVEYSLDNGAIWNQASGTQNFNFTLNNLAVGNYTVLVRAKSLADVYTQSSNYASNSFTVVALPPQLRLNTITPNPTKDQTPTISGVAQNGTFSVDAVEISLNGGESWQKIGDRSGAFSFTAQVLPDGNYEIVARALDKEGNVGLSNPQTLVVDLLQPIIGGSFFNAGSQFLIPDNGVIKGVIGAVINYTLSTKGGVTEVATEINGKAIEFTEVSDEVWQTPLIFDEPGVYSLNIKAQDGADNVQTAVASPIIIEEPGNITNWVTSANLDNVDVTLYFYNPELKNWVVWDGAHFGQQNPVKTSNEHYSFLVPAGKYYLSLEKGGYRKANSEIMNFDNSSIINFDFTLKQRPGITLKLPIIGNIELRLPSLIPDSLPIVSKTPTGFELPAQNLENIDFSSVANLSSALDTKALVSFVSLWSPLSVDQISILNSTVDSLPAEDKIVLVFIQQSQGEVDNYLKRGSYKVASFVDQYGLSLESINPKVLPLNVFVDSHGKSSMAVEGPISKEKILEAFANLK